MFNPLWLYQSKLKSREKMRHTTAALRTIHRGRRRWRLLLRLQYCTFGCILPIPFQLFPLSSAPLDAVLQFCQPNICQVCYWSHQRERHCVCAAVLMLWMWVCTYVCVGDLTGVVVVAAVWAPSGLQLTAEISVPQGAGPDRAEGARGRRGSSSTYPPGWRTGCQAAAAA